MTFTSSKTPLLIHGKTNYAKSFFFFITTKYYELQNHFRKITQMDLLTIRTDVAIIRMDAKFVKQIAKPFERMLTFFQMDAYFLEWIGKPFKQLTDRFKRLS